MQIQQCRKTSPSNYYILNNKAHFKQVDISTVWSGSVHFSLLLILFFLFFCIRIIICRNVEIPSQRLCFRVVHVAEFSVSPWLNTLFVPLCLFIYVFTVPASLIFFSPFRLINSLNTPCPHQASGLWLWLYLSGLSVDQTITQLVNHYL